MTKLLTLVFALWPVFVFGAPVQKHIAPLPCSTDLIALMAKSVGLDSLTPRESLPESPCPTDTVLFIPYGDEQIRVDIRKGVIDHIGLSLFADTLRETPVITAPFDYLERAALLTQLHVDEDFKREREIYAYKVIYDGTSLKKLPSLARKTKNVTVDLIDEKVYTVTWHIDSTRAASVTIPAEYCLLKGTTLPENERRLLEDLKTADSIAVRLNRSPVDEDKIEPTWKFNCFVIKGKSMFSEYLNSDKYYQLVDSTSETFFEGLYNDAYPVESFSNLLKGLNIPNDFRVQVKTVVYPRSLQKITLRLSTLANYFIDRGCEIFTIPTEVTDEHIQFWMLCRNIPMGYCHSLKVKFNAKDTETREGTATASLSTYIPFTRIRNLFAEKIAE